VTEFARQIDALSCAALTPALVELGEDERTAVVRAVGCSVCGSEPGCPCTVQGVPIELHHYRRVKVACEHAGIRETTTPDEET
jgi:hypothetical protein